MSIIEWIAGLFFLAGGFFIVVGGIGMIRMPDLYTRMHAASVAETFGTILVITGLMLLSGWSLATFKLFAVMVFLLFTGPVAAYAIANTASLGGLQPQVTKGDQ